MRPWRIYFNEILFRIQKFSFKEMHLKMPSANWQPFCLCLSVLKHIIWGLVQYRISIRNSDLAKSCLSVTYFAYDQWFWNFAQSTAVSLPCSVQNFKTIVYLCNKLWENEISRGLSLRWVSDRYPILHSPPGGCLQYRISHQISSWILFSWNLIHITSMSVF